MTENVRPASRSGRRRRIGQVILIVLTLVLACCLVTSLVANAGVGGWSLWSYWQLRQEQERTVALQSQVEWLQQVLLESGVEIPLSPADEQSMDAIEQQVALLRGLQPVHSVERALMTEGQLRQRMLQDLEEEFPPQEARDYTLTLAAFDFLDPDLDMYDLLLRLYTEQIAGFYDSETEQIYVIAHFGLMGQMTRLTYAHEFTHALQDQHFDLDALGLGEEAQEQHDSEYLIGVQALVEGDASLMEQMFLQAHYSPAEVAALMKETLEIDMTVLNSVPPILRESLLFPYQDGRAFVEVLYEQGGWAAVDTAYANPPCSTEQILHPERYHAGDVPQIVSLPPLTDTLGTGWRQVDEDVFGEYFTVRYLAQQIPEEDAKAAAEGWGGDRYAVYHRQSDGAVVLLLRIVWDTPADAEEFVDAYVTYAEVRFDHAADVTDGARLCWAGEGDYLCLVWGAADVTIVLAPGEATTGALLALLD